MKAIDIMNEMFSWAPGDFYNTTCDTLKAGSPDAEVTKVAVCCFPSVQVIRDAAAWGAQLLITHEPTYYDHFDNIADTPVGHAKRAFIEQTGLTIYRYHDHPHRAPIDMICAGELEALGWDGAFEKTDHYGIYRYTLKQGATPREIAAHIEQALDIAHVRVCGTMDEPCTRIVTAFGACGGAFDELVKDECELLIAGEACEWQLAEYARDAAQLGFKKTLLILGHCGSERDGMKYVAKLLANKLPELDVRYFKSEEVYSYPER